MPVTKCMESIAQYAVSFNEGRDLADVLLSSRCSTAFGSPRHKSNTRNPVPQGVLQYVLVVLLIKREK